MAAVFIEMIRYGWLLAGIIIAIIVLLAGAYIGDSVAEILIDSARRKVGRKDIPKAEGDRAARSIPKYEKIFTVCKIARNMGKIMIVVLAIVIVGILTGALDDLARVF
ncbi:MAG: hypothetical protein K6F57_03910 [Candidatus Saccharibacteria bacterium]|nr:hypothetical protein [Candidatus Saccharibacteria bacterium]